MIDLQNPPGWIELGKTGENHFRRIEFDVGSWLAEYPNGVVSVLFERPDGILYPVQINATESPACWTVSAEDLSVPGEGRVEIRLVDDDVVGKSAAMRTRTYQGLGAADTPPNNVREDWLDTVLSAAQRAEAARIAAEEAAAQAGEGTPDLSGLAAVAVSGDYNDLENLPQIPELANALTETEFGKALDAVQGKALADQLAALYAGVMKTNLYDSNADGAVDAADTAADSERLGGELPSRYLATEGDASALTVAFSESAQRAALSSGETLAAAFGKIKRFFSDLHTIAFSGSYTELPDKPSSFTPSKHAESHALGGADAITPASIGAGDMQKTIYDTNNNGIADNAEKLGGQLPDYYAAAADVLENVPNAVPGNLPKLTASGGIADSGVIAPLTENKTVYVATSGSDTDGDGTQANPWATIQHAVDMCPAVQSGYTYTIHIGAGTFAGATITDKKIALTADSGVAPVISSQTGVSGQAALLKITAPFSFNAANASEYALYATGGAHLIIGANISVANTATASGRAALTVSLGAQMSNGWGGVVTVGGTTPNGILVNFAGHAYIHTIAGAATGKIVEATTGGILAYASLTGTGTSSAAYGGRIYTGGQTSIPKY